MLLKRKSKIEAHLIF